MRISEENMELALTHRSIETLREKFMSPLSVEQAVYARDAFAKAVYERMFRWLVERLNSSLQNKVRSMQQLALLSSTKGLVAQRCPLVMQPRNHEDQLLVIINS